MPNNNESGGSSVFKLVFFAVVALIALIVSFGAWGHNDNQNWQVVQYPTGTLKVISDGGYYTKWWGTVWTYPKFIQLDYTEDKSVRSPNDDSISVTFNDGGNAKMSTVLRIELPNTEKLRLAFHQQLPDRDGDHSEIRGAVKAHLTNCLKSTGPLMSASEHQTARKSEYTQVVQEQLSLGLFEMRRVERKLLDQFDAKGTPITVFATEVILNTKGQPTVAQPSPFNELGITIKQFSVTGTTYDQQTLAQFSTKKDAFLAAENSKAQREKEVQQRLMVEEKGRREKAEIEAESNKQLAAATIKSQQEKLVAETRATQEKIVAETEAAKLVAVAMQTKITAETAAAQAKAVAELKAQQELEVAKLERQAAEENAKKEIVLADAKKQSIALGGAITEKERVLAEITANRDVQVAANLSKIAVPHVIIGGGNGATGSNDQGITQQLINMNLLRSMNIISDKK